MMIKDFFITMLGFSFCAALPIFILSLISHSMLGGDDDD